MLRIKPNYIFTILFISLFTSRSSSIENFNLLNTSPYFVNEREVSLKIIFKVAIEGHVDYLKLRLTVPHSIKNRQTVNSLSYSKPPDSTYTVNSADYVDFKFTDIDKSFKIVLKSNISIYNALSEKNNDNELDLSKYLHSETDIESESPKILATAVKLRQKTDVETVVKSFIYVQDNIRYEKKTAIGAEKVLETGVGKCMDFSDLLVALCRANSIPAKSMFGIVVDENAENPLHAWPEVYLKKQGWVLFDPTTGHSEIEASGKNFKLDLSNKYIILAEGRNDPEFRASPYSCLYKSKSYCKIKVDPIFEVYGQ